MTTITDREAAIAAAGEAIRKHVESHMERHNELPSDFESEARIAIEAYETEMAKRREDGECPELLLRVMHQAENDLKEAHKEICKLQGLNPETHAWPEWSSPANTLRWFEKIRAELASGFPRPTEGVRGWLVRWNPENNRGEFLTDEIDAEYYRGRGFKVESGSFIADPAPPVAEGKENGG